MDQAVKELTTPGGPHDMGRDAAQILVRGLQLLAKGKPVSKAELTNEIADLDQLRANQLLESMTERNATGDLVGLGLTYNPTAHRVTIDGAKMWAWCAMDTLIYAGILQRTLVVESTPPGSQEVVRFTFDHNGIREVNPSGAVMTWPTVDASKATLTKEAIWGAFCHHSFFFPSRQSAEAWKDDRSDIRIVTPKEAFQAAHEIAEAITARANAGSAPAPTGIDREFHLRWAAKNKAELPGYELIPHICRLLAEGEPVELSRLAAAAGQTVEEVEAKLRAHPGTDWDEAGRLVGAGLTLRPTPHKFTFDGRTVYAFCGGDALMFPLILGRSGVIESEAPTGQPIRVEITPELVAHVDPPTAVISLVRPDRVNDMRGEVCAQGNFWPSREAAAEWLAAYPQGMLHTIAEDFDLNREIIKLSWDLAPR